MRYRVVTSGYADNALEQFEAEVTELLNQGWQLVGGVAVERVQYDDGDSQTYYYQAMYRPEGGRLSPLFIDVVEAEKMRRAFPDAVEVKRS